jgi:hypothetical protein
MFSGGWAELPVTCDGTADVRAAPLPTRPLQQVVRPGKRWGYPLAPHRLESLPGVGLNHDEAGHHPVMLNVEGA